MNKLPFEKIEKEILIKRESETNSELGEDPTNRDVNELMDFGIINMDKYKGPTSHQISDFVKKILGIKKSGHSGTLDPAVTGVLPIALGRSTRVVQTLLKAGKEYVGVMHMHKIISEKELKKVIKKKFTGKIRQLPPIKSAIKRQWRWRTIYYFEILEIEEKDVLFRVGCEAGTYIRKLCSDIGDVLECGAHMAELRRTKAGPFNEDTLCTLHDLKDALWYFQNKKDEVRIRKCIQPIENAVAHIPKVWVMDNAVNGLCHGINLKVPGISKLHSDIEKDQMVALMTLKDELIGIGTSVMVANKVMKEKKGLAVKINKVFMKDGLYKSTKA